MVVGRPIEVVKNPTPSEEEVDKVLAVFKAELIRLYNEHRPAWETRELRFIEK
jgi:hypothetical protein